MCKPHKHDGNGQAVRKPVAELRRIGKSRRVSRHDLGSISLEEFADRYCISLDELIAELGLTQDEIDAADD